MPFVTLPGSAFGSSLRLHTVNKYRCQQRNVRAGCCLWEGRPTSNYLAATAKPDLIKADLEKNGPAV